MYTKEQLLERCTKSNPGCYHTALEYFSLITGISTTRQLRKTEKELYIQKPKNAGPKWKKKLKYKSWSIQVITPEGKQFSYMQAGPKRYDQVGIVADHFLVTVNRSLDEFGIEYTQDGMYNDSYTQADGGGYCRIPLYHVGNFYFAPDMDCAHS